MVLTTTQCLFEQPMAETQVSEKQYIRHVVKLSAVQSTKYCSVSTVQCSDKYCSVQTVQTVHCIFALLQVFTWGIPIRLLLPTNPYQTEHCQLQTTIIAPF